MKTIIQIIVISFILVLTSCEKDELTEPTEILFQFEMEPHQNQGATKSMYGFSIDQCTMVINSIEFDGRREVGEDYYFNKDFSSPLKAEMHTGNANQTVSFDAPIGVYKKIDISFSLGTENEKALILSGKYNQGPLVQIPIHFEYNLQENIRVQSRSSAGNQEIVLKKDDVTKATVIFNTPAFFQLTTTAMIQTATQQNINGQETILINKETNTDIFNLLASRIDNSVQVIFE